jgi:hypothetical protein
LQTEEDFRHTSVVTHTMKNMAWAVVIFFNMFFLYFMMTMGLTRTRDFQVSFVVACMLQLFFEIFVFETLEVAWVQYIIPHLVMKDVRKQILFLREQINDAFDVKLSGVEHPFDATEYLFASARLAKEFPDLFESEIILIFSNYLPGEIGERWNSAKWWRPSNMKGVSFSILLPVLMILQWVGTISMRIQKAVVHVFQPIFCSLGIVLAFFMAANPIWLLVPAAFVFFECYQWYKRKRKQSGVIDDVDLDDIDGGDLKKKPQSAGLILDEVVDEGLKTKPSESHVVHAPSTVHSIEPVVEPVVELEKQRDVDEHIDEPVVEPSPSLKKKNSTFANYEMQVEHVVTDEKASDAPIIEETLDKIEDEANIDEDDDDDDDAWTVYNDEGKPIGVEKNGHLCTTPNSDARRTKRQQRQETWQLFGQFEERQKAKVVSGNVEDDTSNSFRSPQKSMDPFRVAPVLRSISSVVDDDYVPSPYADKNIAPVDPRDMRPGRVHLPPVIRKCGPGRLLPHKDDGFAENNEGGVKSSPQGEFKDVPNLIWEK